MLSQSLFFLFGLIALIAGAEVMVAGASRLAAKVGVSPLIIGLTVVAFGTSAPEGAVTVGAALSGTADLAMGNVVGSNIFNLLLILGATAMVRSLTVQEQLVRQEIPVMIGVSVLLLLLVLDGNLNRFESAGMFAFLCAYTGYLVWQSRRHSSQQLPTAPRIDEPEDGDEEPGQLMALVNRVPAPLQVLIGLVLLVVGGNLLVDSAVYFARALGVSELVIGLTVVAVGTSLPEAATSLAAVLRGQTDLAVGNAVGSNLFNILGCLGLAGMISPTGLNAAPALLNFDLWVMIGAAAVCLPIAFTSRKISRWEGALMFTYCLIYLAYTFMAATHHDGLPAFSWVLASFILPLTAFVLVTHLLSKLRHAPAA